ncbi:beta-ketoacyl-[acyl-carrier-protein] synthase family protein [Ideonella sp. 4Y11]|uniref:Beta-ketoacyl-[acyl-carrier-protein] synthase family protein n=1 Tax=Ideonella aquatica TaxID=2824119 RepID=A0A940YKI7_9BURK|nr:beta-ketoacyl-[acyl-carrier-protein] synthase family protein [Ideonella aquatica]MBQ0957961.1 beta-ketoacyl-[acyl-carrier-protein] synthase family protein [Ideonella aquatica]
MNKPCITGIGVLSSIGRDFDSLAESLRSSRCGTDEISAFDASAVPGRLGSEVRPFDPLEHFDRRSLRRMDRSSQMGVVAARQAMRMAALGRGDFAPLRVGVVMGTTVGGIVNGYRYYERQARTGHAFASLLCDYMLYSAGARIVGEFGLKGPNIAFSTACSSSNVALGHAADLVRHGRLDIVLAGGVDTMTRTTVAGFNALRNVTREAMRPFDKDRTGLVLGEGSAVFVIESEQSARRRGVRPMAEVAGHGMSTDAYHMTAPDASGRGPALAMTRALRHAGLTVDEIDYINAHGTGTRHNDEVETRAIRKVFGPRADAIPVSSTKSMHGHVLGATGAVEAASIVAAMRGDFVPPTINHRVSDPRCDLDVVPNQARAHRIRAALSNNFGFGGNNCALVLRSMFPHAATPPEEALSA